MVKFLEKTRDVEYDESRPWQTGNRKNAAVLRAEPGYEVLVCPPVGSPPPDAEFYYFRETIIAWRIGNDLPPIPVTIDESTSGGNPILCPNGEVILQGAQTWENLESWERDTRAEWQEKRAIWLATETAVKKIITGFGPRKD